MNKAELIDVLADRLGSRRAGADALDAVSEEIMRAVSNGDKVSITGFGVFERRERGARTARNPRTGESVKVKKTKVPAFRAGQGFKDVVTGSKKLAKATSAAKATTGTKKAAKSTTATKAAKSTAKKTVKAAKKVVKKATKTTKKAAKKAAKKTGRR